MGNLWGTRLLIQQLSHTVYFIDYWKLNLQRIYFSLGLGFNSLPWQWKLAFKAGGGVW